MRRHLLIAAGLLALLSPAKAADSTVAAMSAASALGGTELLYTVQGGADRKATPLQMAAYVYGLMSGDATTSGTGTITFATVNANVGTFGSATSCITTTQNAKGLTTAISAATCTPAIGSITGLGTGVATALVAAMNSSTGPVGALTPTNNNCIVGNGTAWTSTTCPGGGGGTGANPTATAGPTAINGVATTFLRSDGAPAVQTGTTGQLGLLQPDGTTITVSSGIISTAPQSVVINPQTGTNYPIVSGDRAKAVYLSNGSNQTPTLPTAASVGANWFASVCNIGAGTQNITPTTSTIGGASAFLLPAASAARPACVSVISDGTNYNVYPDFPMDASMFSAGTVAAARLPFGTGVGTAAAANLSAAGGLTSTVASGTSALGTSAIGSAACATAVTTTATNTATTDVILWGFNGDPTAVTGYVPLVAGMLTIIAYPTANNVNFKVCNNTSSSVTPGAITLNWRVAR